MVANGSLSLNNAAVVLLIVIKSIIPKVGMRNDLNSLYGRKSQNGPISVLRGKLGKKK